MNPPTSPAPYKSKPVGFRAGCGEVIELGMRRPQRLIFYRNFVLDRLNLSRKERRKWNKVRKDLQSRHGVK